jgi:uncharacterized protein (DUF433 family)
VRLKRVSFHRQQGVKGTKNLQFALTCLNFVRKLFNMPTDLQKVEALLASMSADERAKLIPMVVGAAANAFPGIEKTAGVCGGSACIIRTRIPVWTLVAFRDQGLTDAQLLENFPTLRHQDLVNAWNYYLTHQDEIDQEIRDNLDE